MAVYFLCFDSSVGWTHVIFRMTMPDLMLWHPLWIGMVTMVLIIWPGFKSPDLNLIKNLWNKLNCWIKGCDSLLKSVKELVCLLQAKWKKNTTSCHKQLAESMFRRIGAGIASHGSSNNYWMWINVVYLFNQRCPYTDW